MNLRLIRMLKGRRDMPVSRKRRLSMTKRRQQVVRGPCHVVKRGKTPVLTAEEARQLLDSIDVSTTIGLRDRALIGVMV